MFESSLRSVAARAVIASAAFGGTRSDHFPGGATPRRSAGLSSRSVLSSTPATPAMYCSETGPRTSTGDDDGQLATGNWKPYDPGAFAMLSVAKNVVTEPRAPF